MEPPGAVVSHWGAAHVSRALTHAAAAAAAVLILTSTGDVFLAAALLGLLAADATVFGAVALVGVSVLAHWGTTSLTAVAGAQAVLGPAGVVGPSLAAASAWTGAVAVALVAPAGWRRLPFGLLAGLLVCAPAAITPAHLGLRVAGSLGGVGAATVATELPRRVRVPLGLALAAVSVGLAVAA